MRLFATLLHLPAVMILVFIFFVSCICLRLAGISVRFRLRTGKMPRILQLDGQQSQLEVRVGLDLVSRRHRGTAQPIAAAPRRSLPLQFLTHLLPQLRPTPAAPGVPGD
jgi:hypothetical protein